MSNDQKIKWQKLKEIISKNVIAIVLACVSGAFALGLILGEKGLFETESSHRLEKNSLKENYEVLKKNTDIAISSLKSQIEYLKKDNASKQEELKEAEDKYIKLAADCSGVKKSRDRYKKIVNDKRPFLDVKEDSEGGYSIDISVFNASYVPLRATEVVYQIKEDGISKDTHRDIKNIILHPSSTKNIPFHFFVDFEKTYKEIDKNTYVVESVNITDWRASFCIKYTSLNEHDKRYWIYQACLKYDTSYSKIRIYKDDDFEVNEKTICDLDKL